MKELSPTLAGILVLVFAVLPGVPAEWLYRAFVGANWREDQWRKTLRLLTFSLFGLALYASVAPLVHAPFPTYLSPALLDLAARDPASLRQVLLALLGHFAGSSLTGMLAGGALRLIARLRSSTAYYSAWDHFVRNCAKNHWVLVSLQNGETYSGFIETADTSVASSERDIVLREPAIFNQDFNEYRTLPYQTLFLPGPLQSSIAVVTSLRTNV